ncbi:hypothetical protein ACSVH5_02390 [Flavobacterium sp. RSSA_27]|uniref:hypothetical protein n=1 Tax=Flavobacterium sp. RSSA_27 TaxID=3447667 RepID=UPI003F361FAB
MRAILIEDRPDRQKLFLSDIENGIEQLKDIYNLDIPSGQDCRDIITAINDEKFHFDGINLIMIHKSSLSSIGINYLIKLSQGKVTLVFFSGNIDQLIYDNTNIECLHINSKDFYSSRLIPYIKDFIADLKPHVLELKNKDWKLSYFFLLRQLFQNRVIEDDYEEKHILTQKIEKIKTILNIKEKEDSEILDFISKETDKIMATI